MADPGSAPTPLQYADAALSRAARLREAAVRRGARRCRFVKITFWVGLPALVLLGRHLFIQSHRNLVEMDVGIALDKGDALVDIERDIGRDRNDYFKLRLTTPTYQALFARVKADASTRPSMFRAKWPWWVPSDAVIVETGDGYGATYLFSPSKRLVFVYSWSM